MTNKKLANKPHPGFISAIDLHLAEFDRTHEVSASQQAEINKYKRIHQMRDQPTVQSKEKSIWDS